MRYDNQKPIVTVACLCERVLREEDGVLSAIRILDRFIIRSDKPVTVQATALVCLRSGALEGKSEVSLEMRSPSGRLAKLPQRFPILLKGKTHGANLIVGLLIPGNQMEFGEHAVDVFWNGKPLTTIPFEITQAQARTSLPE
jgi:hypothetical protein